MARVAVRIVLQVVLVLRLGLPERHRRPHLGHDLARPQARRVDAGGHTPGDPSLLTIASAIVGTALLVWGIACLCASLIVWMPSSSANADPVLVGFAVASAAVSSLLGFTGSGEVAFGASALFVIAAFGVWLDNAVERYSRTLTNARPAA